MRNPSSEILHQAAKRVHLKTASCAARTACLETDCKGVKSLIDLPA